jgi:hypothetical protein
VKGLLVLLLPLFLLTGCSSENTENIPQPTKTVYVPVPQSGNNSGLQEELESSLDEIRQSNCRLSQDLLMQSINLGNQARDLESQAFSLDSLSDAYFKLNQQASQMRNQSIDLLVKSGELSSNC